MKKIALLVSLLFFQQGVFSQAENTVKTFSGLQGGALGIWGFKEFKVAPTIATRLEFGTRFGFGSGIGLTISPTFTIEPRWYYNIGSRARKGLNINGNSANYFGLKTSYNPFTGYTGEGKLMLAETHQFSFSPYWGMRRGVSDRTFIELGLGVSYNYTIAKFDGFSPKRGSFSPMVHLRIGF